MEIGVQLGQVIVSEELTEQNFNYLNNKIGDLEELETTNKDSVVDAINELADFRISPATENTLGSVIVGDGLDVDENGVISVSEQSISWSDVQDKPNFATVATSGSYNDLSNKPDIPSLTGYATEDWVENKGYLTSVPSIYITESELASEGFAKAANLANVATSGSYGDLSNTPTVPTKTSQLANDSNFVVDANYTHIDNNFTNEMKSKLNGIEAGAQVNVQSDWNANSGDAFIKNKPSLAAVATSGAYSDLSGRPALSTVATSGSYNDLSNKPSIPSALADLTADTTHRTVTDSEKTTWNNKSDFSGSYNDLTDKPTIPSAYVLPIASAETLGGIKVGTGLSINSSTGVLSASVSSLSWDNITDKPNFATVATSGSYTDLSNKPTIPEAYVLPAATANSLGGIKVGTGLEISDGVLSVSGSGSSVDWSDISNKPNFATVATSGSYNDLSNKPIIPAAYVLPIAGSDTLGGIKVGSGLSINSKTGVLSTNGVAWSDITGKPSFATVATSGSYTDLTNKPSIPTKVSDLTNDSGFIVTETDPVFVASAAYGISSSDITNWNGKSNFSGSYTDLTNKPNLATVATSGSYSDLTNKPTYATVASTGNYSDLSGKPTIPTKVSDLTNDSGFITSYTETDPVFVASAAYGISSSDITAWNDKSNFSGSYNDLTDKPTIVTPVKSNWNETDNTSLAYILNKPTIPTQTSQLTNNSNFVVGDSNITNIVKISQSDYTNLSSKDATTLYIIAN